MSLPPVILTVNVGSSSTKFALFTNDQAPACLGHARTATNGAMAAVAILRWLAEREPARVSATAHRIVHGGEAFDRSCILTTESMSALRGLIPLAPNHLPDELALIDALAEALPDVPQIGCFDTAFHRTLPDVARTLPLPGVRRFGFHGLSYTYLMSELERLDGPRSRGRVILAHLGSGASLAAVRQGRSVDTTMGLTPAGGLLMSSRSGDLDPGVITYLMRSRHLSADDVDALVTKQSGLLAVSGQSADMKVLLEREADDPRARLAVAMFCYQATKAIGGFTAALGGLDMLVFSGGIGEGAAAVRQRICEPLAFLGLGLDHAANEAHAAVVSSPQSRVTVRVIAANEEIVMATEAAALIAAHTGEP